LEPAALKFGGSSLRYAAQTGRWGGRRQLGDFPISANKKFASKIRVGRRTCRGARGALKGSFEARGRFLGRFPPLCFSGNNDSDLGAALATALNGDKPGIGEGLERPALSEAIHPPTVQVKVGN
jgi:hypothetical protein